MSNEAIPVMGKILTKSGEVPKKVNVLGPTYLFGISRNRGTKAPYTLYFEQEISTDDGKISTIMKGSGYAVKNSHRKTALQAFTRERLLELGFEEAMDKADESDGLYTLPEKVMAKELFEGADINISIEETTEFDGYQQPKKAGSDGPELLFEGANIYVNHFLVAGIPTFRLIQHDEINVKSRKQSGTQSPF